MTSGNTPSKLPVETESEDSGSDRDEEAANNEMDEETSADESEDEKEYDNLEDEEGSSDVKRVYLPNFEKDKDVELECDETAYVLFHKFKTGAPCLSFDIISDKLGSEGVDRYPLSLTIACGTQISAGSTDSLLVTKLSNMHRNKDSKSDDENSSDSEDESKTKPIMQSTSIKHNGCVNRIKVATINSDVFAASWSESSKVYLWNLSEPVTAVNDLRLMRLYLQRNESPKPIFTFNGHSEEGYALQWSPLIPGVLASGDCKSRWHLWKPIEGGTWNVDKRPYTAHTASVEDIQWSPNENNVLATCSVDKSIRIWDIRAAPSKACMLTRDDSHDSDVNAIAWNRTEPFILSGGDDGKLRVWDIRKFPKSDPVCTFKHHTAPITSVEWHPTDSSVFAASSADDQLTQWDLAIERDENMECEESPDIRALPPQLLFMHMGQKEIKELHWHPQIPGVLISTALNGLNVIQTLSV